MNEDSHPLFAPQNPNCEVQAERDNWVDPWPRPLALGPRDARRGLQHTDRTDVPPSLLAPELPCVCVTPRSSLPTMSPPSVLSLTISALRDFVSATGTSEGT